MHKSTDSSMISRGPQLRQTTVALELVEQEKTKTDNKTKAQQLRKFEGLLNEKSNRRRDDECLDNQKVVRNLSTHSLTERKRCLGPGTKLPRKSVPVMDIIAELKVQLMNYRRKKQ